jgi:hypothetical protein
LKRTRPCVALAPTLAPPDLGVIAALVPAISAPIPFWLERRYDGSPMGAARRDRHELQRIGKSVAGATIKD